VLSLAQAANRRGYAGIPLPGMYPALAARDALVCRGQVTLVVGPPSAGKSLLIMNLMVRMDVPSLGFFLDTDQLTAAARFGAIITRDKFWNVKNNIDDYQDRLAQLGSLQAVFWADDMDDIRRQGEAYEQRYGVYPSLLVVDNLGNFTSGMGDEWALLKAMTWELDKLAKEWQCAVVAAHHTTDLTSADPAARDKILGKISQYPRLILSVGFNPDDGVYKVAHVKNSNGPSDKAATNPVIMYADPSRMFLSEDNPNWSPSGSLAGSVARTGWAGV
jgi:hypothetical protein